MDAPAPRRIAIDPVGVLSPEAYEGLTSVLTRLDALTLTVVRLGTTRRHLPRHRPPRAHGRRRPPPCVTARRTADMAPALSRPVRQLLTGIGMATTKTVDLAGWAAATRRRPNAARYNEFVAWQRGLSTERANMS